MPEIAQFLLKRRIFTEKSVIGELYIPQGVFCHTLEPPLGHPTHPCIPLGTYPLKISWSPKFKADLPHILDVPGRSAIEIHVGNAPEDTEGCILVGYGYGLNYVDDSAVAFRKLMMILRELGDTPMTLTVQDKGVLA